MELGWRLNRAAKFRNRLKKEAPDHVFNLWWDNEAHISEKYKLTNWQQSALTDILHKAFLKDIQLITIPNNIKDSLKIKDENIVKSIALDIAIHIFSLAKDYFINTDNLIKSLGGEEAYFKKYTPNYWNDVVVAQTLITPGDMENAYNMAKKEVSEATIALKELEKINSKDIVPEMYTQIHSKFSEVKSYLDSGNYDFIRESERLAKDVIDDVNDAKKKVLEYEKNIEYRKNIEKKISSLKTKCAKEKELFKILKASLWLALICLVSIFLLGQIVFYFFYATIIGLNFAFNAYMEEKEKASDIVMSIIAFLMALIMGIILAPLFLIEWGSLTKERDKIIQSRYSEYNSLKKSMKQ